MKLKFNRRKWWHLKNNKSIHFEISGCSQNPSIYLRIDGSEREISFHFSLFIGIWITFENFLPKSWYPKRWSKYCNDWLGDEKEIKLCWHGGSLWWDIWTNDDTQRFSLFKYKGDTWRCGVFSVVDLIKGKHKYERKEIERREFMLPFFEGNYNVEVIKYLRTDKYKRWFTHKMISWEVRPGYYENGKWNEQGIPVEGKGESSYDCGEDATYAMSFPGQPINKFSTCYQAALYFWKSMMESRERYGSPRWIPERFKNTKLEIIRKVG